MSQVIVITGMGRSGTSLVSSLLQRAGVHIGDQLLPPYPDNPRGYFEDVEFYEFHEQLLHERSLTYLYVDTDFVFEPTSADRERAPINSLPNAPTGLFGVGRIRARPSFSRSGITYCRMPVFFLCIGIPWKYCYRSCGAVNLITTRILRQACKHGRFTMPTSRRSATNTQIGACWHISMG